MYGSPLEEANQASIERALDERKRREEEERQLVDQMFPPEKEAIFEELIETLPFNVRQRLEHAKAVLAGMEINPSDRPSFVADTIELLDYFSHASMIGSPLLEDEYRFRRHLFSSKSNFRGHVATPPVVDWLGSDAFIYPEVQARVYETYVRTLKIIRTRWRVIRQLVHTFIPESGTNLAAVNSTKEWLRQEAAKELRLQESAEVPQQLAEFPEEIRHQLLRNTFSVELTEGCSVRCMFCAFDAPSGVRNVMSFEDVLWILDRVNKKTFLYYATDPLDYRVNTDGHERSYADVLDAFVILKGNRPFTSTAVPAKGMDVLHRVADRLDRLSLSVMNEQRLIREGMIERTEGGTYLPIDPDLSSRFWHGPFSPWTDFDPKIIRLTQKSEKKKLENEQTIYYSGRQRARPHEEGHANGDSVGDSIACRDGIVLSVKSAKNSVRMMSTKEYPNGIAEAALTPEHLVRGAEEVGRLIQRVENKQEIMIEDLLPYVVVSFAYTMQRDLKTADGARATLDTPKQELALNGEIGFQTFQRREGKVISVSGSCKFDRISGKIQILILEQ